MLVKSTQVESNLRRTANKGLISLLNHGQMEKLALDYFGIKNEYGDIIAYQCPYSGKIYTDYNGLVLEHIIPVISKGGTVLFNCIPTSEEVNKAGEKGAKHLISWWTSSRYWDEEAPFRLEKLVNYILDGYDKVFDEYTIEEVENSYLEIETDESILEEQDDNQYRSKKESQLLEKQSSENGIHSYLGFLLNCIQTLEKFNIDATSIRQKLNTLQSKHIFEDIDRFQLFQNILQQIVESRIGDDNRSTLTYVLNFNKKKLMDSITSNNQEEIYNEIDFRLKNIEDILKQNNLSIVDYFKSLGDISDIDIIYKNINAISQDEKNIFLENIKLGIDSKIDIFINMLNKGSRYIFDRNTQETFEGYNNIKIGEFWHINRKLVINRLFEELKNNSKYNKAREIVDEYIFINDLSKKIEVFINMLNKGNSEILKMKNNITFEGYSNVGTSNFFGVHKEKIKQKLFVELKDNAEYDTARRLIDVYEMTYNIDKQIPIFINMLNKGNTEILKTCNNRTLEGYPSIKLSQFWNMYKNRVKQKLFVEFKDNTEYNMARILIDVYEMTYNIDKQIPIFINMLNKGNDNILKKGNNQSLEGYPNINLSYFWQTHKEKIKQKLFVELKDNAEYDSARRLIDVYEMTYNIDKQIPIFINMLNKGNNEILKKRNNETLDGYSNINLSYFWNDHKEKIKQKLFVELKDNVEYDTARRMIDVYELSNSTDTQVLIFIEMLNKGNTEILKARNNQTLEGYPSIKLSQFWYHHKEKIKQKLFVELKDTAEYDTARRMINEFEMSNNISMQISIFINMLNKGNSGILKDRNNQTLEGYSNIKLSKFWSNHKEKVINKLFFELKSNTVFDIARQLILNHCKVSNIEEYCEKERKSKELKELKKMKKILEIAEQGLTEEVTEGRKRA